MPFLYEETVVPGGAEEGAAAGQGAAPGDYSYQNAPKGLDPQTVETVRQSPDPDKAARIRGLSRDLNVPETVIQGQPEVFEKDRKTREIEAQTRNFPVTQDLLNDPSMNVLAWDSVEELTLLEQLSRAVRAGRKTVELGEKGTEWRSRPNDPFLEQQVLSLQEEMQTFNLPTDGWKSWLAASGEVVGQMYESLVSVEGAKSVTAGAGAGALAGATAGGVGAVPGAITGAGIGATGFFAWKSYVIEGGSSYVEMRQEGIDEDVAQWLSHGVGVINAALEVGGAAAVLKPLSNAAKAAMKRGIREAVKQASTRQLVQRAADAYGMSIAGEVSTELMQEVVQMTAAEIGKDLSDDPNLESLTAEEWASRLQEITEKTFKAMAVLALPGAGLQLSTELAAAKRANENATSLQAMHETAMEGDLFRRDPTVVGDFFARNLREQDVRSVYIGGEDLQNWLTEVGNPELAAELGIDGQIEASIENGVDVEISGDVFANRLMTHPGFAILSPYVRTGQFEMNAAEAQEYAESGLAESVAEAAVAEPAADPMLDVAEAEAGMQGFFRTAEEAGMTENEYQTYLEQRAAAKDKAAERKRLRDMREELREIMPEWQEELTTEREIAREHLTSEPVYQALNGIGAERLDSTSMEVLAEELGIDLETLPTQSQGRRIYAAQGEAGMDVDVYAELNGYTSAEEMVLDMATAVPFDQAVEALAQKNMEKRHGSLTERVRNLEGAIKSFTNEEQSTMLRTELNALRKAQGQKKVTAKAIRLAAKDYMDRMSVSAITSSKALAAASRAGKEARKALRQGDYATANKKKFQQLMNWEVVKKSSKVSEEVRKRRKYMQKFATGKWEDMPVENMQAIREILSEVNMGSRITEDRLIRTKELANSAKTADAVKLWHKLQDRVALPNWQDLSLADFNDMYDKVREIRHKGVEATKLKLEAERNELDAITDAVSEAVYTNLKPTSAAGKRAQNIWESVKDMGRGIQTLVFTMDTITRAMDGWKDLGVSYQNTKGRFDRALAQGYRPDQIGYLRRHRKVSNDIQALAEKFFTKKERGRMKTKQLTVPGVHRTLTHEEIVSVLLNSGNEGNLTAMVEGGNFSQEEIEAIHQFASKKDWDFAQATWDYIDTYFDEIAEAMKRRRNQIVEKVEAQEIETPHGTYKGGYYPIRYDTKLSLKDMIKDENFEELAHQARYGAFIQQHTARGHVEERTGPGANPVLLDLFVLNSHMDRVIFDLEAGDALSDIHKIWFSDKVKRAFAETGYQHFHEAGTLWFMDAVSQEIIGSDVLQRVLRNVRAGFTVSKLALNVGVALQQPLGLIQSSVHLGHSNMLRGLFAFMRSKWVGPNNVFRWIDEQSGFMEARGDTFDKDVIDAKSQFTRSWMSTILPGDMAEFARRTLFLPIRKTQRLTDAITWLAGYHKGLKEFNGDMSKAVALGDRAVSRSQASGIFTERSAVERGTATKNFRQNELVRIWTVIISYFIAKNNVMFERYKSTDFKLHRPDKVVALAADFALLYVVETWLANLLTGRGPDEAEPEPDEYALWLGSEVVATGAAGFPFGRELVTAARGFAPGGSFGSFSEDVGRSWTQVTQGEFDASLVKSLNNVGGVLFKYPSSQMNKAITAHDKLLDGEDVTFMDYLLGYQERN